MSPVIRDYEYYREVFRDQVLPLAFVDLDLFDANIAAVRERAGDMRIRIAAKSVRCVPLLNRILEADVQFAGLMCFSGAEAVFLSQLGFDDLLLGYPVWREVELAPLCNELRAGKRIVCMVDCPEHIDHLNEAGKAFEASMPVCIDADMSYRSFMGVFGVRRSPIDTPAKAAALAKRIVEAPHLRLEGVMAYEAQIAGVPDHFSGRPAYSAFIRCMKRRSRRDVLRRRRRTVRAVVEAAHELTFVNGGGTGSIEFTASDDAVTEITVGSAFFGPALFDRYRAFQCLPAAGFAVEVTRIPEPGAYTCAGGGYAASGPAGFDRLPTPYLPAGARLLANEGAGEVQTPISYCGDASLGMGDPVFFRHAKAGELCERFNSLFLVSEGGIFDEVPTYRGEGQAFL